VACVTSGFSLATLKYKTQQLRLRSSDCLEEEGS
jgi:hypothetical protein